MVSAASWTFSKIEDEVVLDAAHDEAVEERDAAARAGAGEDAAGRQEGEVGHAPRRSSLVQRARSRFGSVPAAALATRAQVSAMLRSSGVPSAALRRYFISQICSEMRGRDVRAFMRSEIYRKHPTS